VGAVVGWELSRRMGAAVGEEGSRDEEGAGGRPGGLERRLPREAGQCEHIETSVGSRRLPTRWRHPAAVSCRGCRHCRGDAVGRLCSAVQACDGVCVCKQEGLADERGGAGTSDAEGCLDRVCVARGAVAHMTCPVLTHLPVCSHVCMRRPRINGPHASRVDGQEGRCWNHAHRLAGISQSPSAWRALPSAGGSGG
jgi:hypothetical protein